MEGNQSGSGSSASPAPFLLKTYEMVDDSKTDEIVSWSSKNNSFIVWNPPEFSRLLLPTYFKHNNFSSFIRQLNTYGFRKIDPEKWEFHNEDFLKDQKHLLKNIYRRKPVHSHSQPTISEDQERTTLEEKIESLEQEKITLLADLSRFKQHLPGAKLYLDELERRVKDMESRQLRMIQYVEDAVNNPSFVEHLVQMAEPFSDISSINRKRRLPNGTYPLDLVENSFIENSSSTNVQPEVVHIFHPDFSNKLRLQLSPAISEGNLCLYENGDTVPKNPTDGDQRNLLMMKRSISLVPEDAEHSEHSAPPLTSKKNQSLSKTIGSNGRPEFHNLRFHEEDDAYMSCQLNLTLSSSPLQVNGSHCPSKILHCSNKDENCSYDKEIHDDSFVKSKSQIDCDTTKSLAQETSVVNEVHGVSQVAVNDVFWERFLTERPGCSDTEEASSSLREGPQDEQEDGGQDSRFLFRNKMGEEKITL